MANPMETGNASSQEGDTSLSTKDVNENLSELSHEEKVLYIEKEVQTLLEFCLSKGMSEKEIAKCVSAFTGETSSAAKRFYNTNSRFLFTLAILAVIGAIAFGWEPAYEQMNVHARLLSLKILPYWDWSYLFNEECFINNPYRKEKKITKEDCSVCRLGSAESVERLQNVSLDVIAQDFLFEARPVIITDATRNWLGVGNFTVNNLHQLYTSHKDLQDLQECTFFCNVDDIKNVYNFFDAYQTGELPIAVGFFMFLENCNQKASKAIRRFYGRPYFLPQSTEMSRFNQLFIGRGKVNIEDEKEEQPLIEQEEDSGSWLAVVSGKIDAMLYPLNDCKQFGCSNVTVSISAGEALLVPHDIYKFKFVSASEGVTIAVSSSLNWDERS